MARLKIGDDDLNIKELENAEYDEDKEVQQFEDYDGEIPPKGTILNGYVKHMWYGYTKNDDPKLVTLFIASDNVGSLAEYNGLPIWEHAALTASSKFKWFPLLNSLGLTIRDVKTNTEVDEGDNIGDPIISIADWEPGEDSDGAYLRVLTDREKYNGELQARAGKWLVWEDPVDDEDSTEEEPEPEEPPARGRARSTSNGKAATRTRKSQKTEEDEEGSEEPAQAKAGRGRAKAASTASAGRGSKPAARRGGRGKADDEPPF